VHEPMSLVPTDTHLLIRAHAPAAGVGIVRPAGRLDAFTAPALLEQLKFRLHDGVEHDLVLDVQDITVIDAAGVAALLAVQREARDCAVALHITGLSPLLAGTGLPVRAQSTEELVDRLLHPRALLTTSGSGH
jgi:anti-anti-sigma factor